MCHYSNPTANDAIGAVDREIQMMRKRAEQNKCCRKNGQADEGLASLRKQSSVSIPDFYGML